LRHADAPAEIVEAGAFGKHRDLSGHAATVLPRHAAMIFGAEDAHQARLAT
jgi:hypothetical protein